MGAANLDEDPGARERRAALIATGCVAGAGFVAVAYPFAVSMGPSAKARAEGGPVDVEIGNLDAGQLRTVLWRGRPVWVMRRSPAMVQALEKPSPVLLDPMSKNSEQPDSCRNPTRSVRPDLFACVGICTHLGCIPNLRLDDAALNAELQAPGGFLCPCHGSRFDLAGRVVRNVPAPRNLEIPPYAYTSDTRIRLGEKT